MTKAAKAGYLFGLIVGWIFIYGLYFIGIYGVVTEILNREIPYIPLIFIISIYTMRNIARIYVANHIGKQIELMNTISSPRNEQIDEGLRQLLLKMNNMNGYN